MEGRCEELRQSLIEMLASCTDIQPEYSIGRSDIVSDAKQRHVFRGHREDCGGFAGPVTESTIPRKLREKWEKNGMPFVRGSQMTEAIGVPCIGATGSRLRRARRNIVRVRDAAVGIDRRSKPESARFALVRAARHGRVDGGVVWGILDKKKFFENFSFFLLPRCFNDAPLKECERLKASIEGRQGRLREGRARSSTDMRALAMTLWLQRALRGAYIREGAGPVENIDEPKDVARLGHSRMVDVGGPDRARNRVVQGVDKREDVLRRADSVAVGIGGKKSELNRRSAGVVGQCGPRAWRDSRAELHSEAL